MPTKDFLNDSLWLIKQLGLSKLSPDQIECLIQSSGEKSQELFRMGIFDQRKLILQLIKKVVITSDEIKIKYSKRGLIYLLELEDTNPVNEKNLIKVHPIKLKKRGVEKKLILLAGNTQTPKPDLNLIKTVSQGRVWFEQLIDGTFKTIKDIATKNNTDNDNVWRTMRLAFLAPDIVKAILNGHQPIQLTAFKLKRLKDLPPDWEAQRVLLEFPHPTYN